MKSKIHTLKGLIPLSLCNFSKCHFAGLKILPLEVHCKMTKQNALLHKLIEIICSLKLLQSNVQIFSEMYTRKNSLTGRTWEAIKFFHLNCIHLQYQSAG